MFLGSLALGVVSVLAVLTAALSVRRLSAAGSMDFSPPVGCLVVLDLAVPSSAVPSSLAACLLLSSSLASHSRISFLPAHSSSLAASLACSGCAQVWLGPYVMFLALCFCLTSFFFSTALLASVRSPRSSHFLAGSSPKRPCCM